MKKLLYSILILTFFSTTAVSQDLKPEYQKFIKLFIDNVKKNKREAVAASIRYPLSRENPIPSIKNKTEFLKRYDAIFDAALKNEIIKSDPAKNWSEVGWRGIMLNQGTIWFETDGKLKSITYHSKAEEALKDKLIAAQKDKLHSSIANFKAPVYILETSKFKIRIDDLGKNKYRYASWSAKQSMSEKPDLVITNGEWVPDGSGGNSHFNFKKGNFLYRCDINVLREKDAAPASLVVFQNNKEIVNQSAKIVPR